MRGFFNPTAIATAPAVGLLPKCGQCGLHRGCESPKMPVAGRGRRRILVVGEAPGKDEDEQGVPFIGKAGQRLRRELERVGIDLDRDCWTTNSLICRPPKNRTPTPDEIGFCRPNVVNAIKKLNPEKILLFGAAAVRSVIGWRYKADVGAVGQWVGFNVPLRDPNAWACPLWHPSYLERAEGQKDGPVIDIWFRRHLAAAAALEGRPWAGTPPDYAALVDCEMDPEAAADKLAAYADAPAVAFDYETDRLKPDAVDARIVCASVSDGNRALAFPLVGPAVPAMRELLRAPVAKIGWNIKFEERWSKAVLKTRVRNWAWDGQLVAHVLDNRQGITGLEFQAFAVLGQPPWDAAVSGFLRSVGKGGVNRIAQAPLGELLRYCGIDSLVEFHVAQNQRKALREVRGT